MARLPAAPAADAQAPEHHHTQRVGWLRAAVLGANDGIVSTASLVLGVAAANADSHSVLLTGVAGLVAGAMSMAAGEYVSVHAQADTEQADLGRERAELQRSPASELQELAALYQARGLQPALALQVAGQLTATDALAAHARDELGISSTQAAQPLQAAWASAAAFSVGAALPLLVTLAAGNRTSLMVWLAATALLALAGLGALSAWAGGAALWPGVWRVSFWGALAMALTTVVGRQFGAG
ncbi:VIT1/CCC1 transporter family protein [Pseudaquabacterium pictum]|uniref:Membrane protein n=1 Tax=Pseudaquabacterium pictum TaxID=2315236 RepID=A0A480AJ93_9BURK|nr:VIT family protein [Rubrivivax pictus]GCL61819.1 membrane protein [Rubrivivax pictus]